MFTLFGNRSGRGSNTAFILGAVALVGSFYFNDGGDSKNALFLCAAGAVLFGISWFLDRTYYKEVIDDQARASQFDSIYRDLDEIRDKIDCCKKSCKTSLNEEMDGIHRRIDNEVRDLHDGVSSAKCLAKKEIDELTRCVEQNDFNAHNYVNEQVRELRESMSGARG